jgi:hypothetical protein
MEIANIELRLSSELGESLLLDQTAEEKKWLDEFSVHAGRISRLAKERISSIEHISLLCNELSNLDYEFLYDKSQHLLTIGYNAEEHRRDNSYYDLLASEARLCTFVGISQGKLPQDSWFALGRQLTNTGGGSALLSWSGSMFEYLMPLLVMPTMKTPCSIKPITQQ